MRRELDAKLDDKIRKHDNEEKFSEENKRKQNEKEIIDGLVSDLESARTEYNRKSNPSQDDKGKYYLIEESFYMALCRVMKKHGLYFRESDDPSQAILRR
jgi:hypothetical protein